MSDFTDAVEANARRTEKYRQERDKARSKLAAAARAEKAGERRDSLKRDFVAVAEQRNAALAQVEALKFDLARLHRAWDELDTYREVWAAVVAGDLSLAEGAEALAAWRKAVDASAGGVQPRWMAPSSLLTTGLRCSECGVVLDKIPPYPWPEDCPQCGAHLGSAIDQGVLSPPAAELRWPLCKCGYPVPHYAVDHEESPERIAGVPIKDTLAPLPEEYR